MDNHEQLSPEVIALINQRVAEGLEEAKRPKPEPRPAHKPGHYETQPSSELKALLLETLDLAAKEGLSGDNQMYHVFWILYGQSSTGGPGERIYHSHTPDKRVTQLLDEWRGCPMNELDWMERIAERSRIAQICRQLDVERNNPNYKDELLAEMNRTYEGMAENARWREDARRPSDLTLEELEALLQAKRAKVKV